MNKQERPLITVGALVVASDGDILLVRSKKWQGRYSIPGGKVELGETREQAVKREIKEETGLDVSEVKFVLVQESIYSPEFFEKRHFVMHDFIALLSKKCRKEDVILNDEAEEFLWITPKDALQLNLQRECRILIQWHAGGSQ